MSKILLSLTDMKSHLEKNKFSFSGMVSKLTSKEDSESRQAGMDLAKLSADYGLSVRDFLKASGFYDKEVKSSDLNGYEYMLSELNLPFKDNLIDGVYLAAASDTFQTHAGTRALFPEVIDDVVRFQNHQDQFETVDGLVGNSRTINGTELISTVIIDEEDDRQSFMVAEGTQIPTRTIKTGERSVKMWKHGSAIRSTYEFQRRAGIDLLIPHANRIARDLEISKVAHATAILTNGDGENGAAPVTNQSSFNTTTGVTATAGHISWKHVLKWLVTRASAGKPIDTVAMNWDGVYQWMILFASQQANNGPSANESLQRAGVGLGSAPNVLGLIRPVLSSTVAANTLLGYSRADTLEELIENGSNIQETERIISNQTLFWTKTETRGYKLVYGDTRSIFDFGN